MFTRGSLFNREIVPFSLSLLALAVAALLIDAVLHVLDAVWIGRYLGIPGTILILISIAYSARKRKLISIGSPVALLRFHEQMAWAGSLLVLVHAGIHFNAILAWLAVVAMVINVGSGLTGKFLLQRSRRRLQETRQKLQDEGISPEALRERMYWDTMTFDVVKEWRVVHYPITLAFAILSTAHIIAVFLFWGWH